MNKLFITESVDDLKLEAASLIDSYIFSTVANDETEAAKDELKEISKKVQKLVIALIAIITILKVVKTTIKKNKEAKENEKGNPNFSNSTIHKAQHAETSMSIAKALDISIQEANAILNELNMFKADVEADRKELEKITKERKDIANRYKNDPDIKAGAKKRLNELHAQEMKITKDAKEKSAKLNKKADDVIKRSKNAIGYGGSEADYNKLNKIIETYRS